jgi:hypothetical protein
MLLASIEVEYAGSLTMQMLLPLRRILGSFVFFDGSLPQSASVPSAPLDQHLIITHISVTSSRTMSGSC